MTARRVIVGVVMIGAASVLIDFAIRGFCVLLLWVSAL